MKKTLLANFLMVLTLFLQNNCNASGDDGILPYDHVDGGGMRGEARRVAPVDLYHVDADAPAVVRDNGQVESSFIPTPSATTPLDCDYVPSISITPSCGLVIDYVDVPSLSGAATTSSTTSVDCDYAPSISITPSYIPPVIDQPYVPSPSTFTSYTMTINYEGANFEFVKRERKKRKK